MKVRGRVIKGYPRNRLVREVACKAMASVRARIYDVVQGTTAACNTSLSYIILGSNQAIIETFSSAKDFWDSFPGFRFTNRNTNQIPTERLHRPLYLILLTPLSCTRQNIRTLLLDWKTTAATKSPTRLVKIKPAMLLNVTLMKVW